MYKNSSLLFFSLLFILTGCVGPLLNHETGQTIGDGNHNIRLISTTDNYYGFAYDYGVSKNLDLGVQYESLNFGFDLKYSFINAKSGWALAGMLGTGSTFGGSYTFAGINTSYGVGAWNHFVALRYTSVSINEQEFTDADTGDVFVTTPSVSYGYSQAFIGTKYRIAEWFSLGGEVGSFISSKDVEFDNNAFISVAFDFNF